jgi:ParB family chromosome partitioning protein
MSELQRIKLKRIQPSPLNPRTFWDNEELLLFGGELKQHGQQVPGLVYPLGDMFELLSGERRWRALTAIGADDMLCLVLAEKPSPAKLHILLNSLDAHSVALNSMERSNLLQRIRTELNCSVVELAKTLHMKQPLVSKLLSLQKLSPQLRQRVLDNVLGFEKAYLVSQEPDAARQEALANQAETSDREQLRRTVNRSAATTEPKVSSARFDMPCGIAVILQGKGLTLPRSIEVLSETTRILKKAHARGLSN